MRNFLKINRTIRAKVFIMGLLLLAIPSLIIGLIGYQSSKGSLDELGKTNLKNSVEQAVDMIEIANQSAQSGNLSLEEAKETVKEQLLGPMQEDGTRPINSTIDLGENGYFFVLDEKGTELAHPSLEGENIWESQDSNGVMVAQELIKNGTNGGGFTYFEWPLPNDSDTVAPKVSYSLYEPAWGWVIVSGTYMMDFNSGASQILNTLLITLSAALILGAIIIWFFSNRLTKPIKQLSDHSTRIAEGDFTVADLQVSNKDEIGVLVENFNTMKNNLKALIESVSASSEQVAAASQQLNANAEENSLAAEQVTTAIQEVAAGSDQQMDNANESSEWIHDISSNIQTISTQMINLSEKSNQTAETSGSGEKLIHTALQQMHEINDHTNTTSGTIQVLEKKSNEIGKIVSLITDISEQTNLLALNAAIEAARAGEHGKGFAVVAEEVRKLAEQSSQSANHIMDLVHDIQQKTQEAVQFMNKSDDAVKSGVNVVGEAEQTFKTITTDVHDLSGGMNDITGSIQSMTHHIQSLVESFEAVKNFSVQASEQSQHVAATTEQQNASIQEITSASETLAEEASNLQEQVSRFRY
ncbi:methyl-accepting chemotaxis protein [Halobacillus sp. Nhm2S1]|uniref:methyl-accepting chemotaxis protein n=1 Tax=Halobacillus sp. Nhm2S1 TaxID=2866716 RepID=UPI001C732237|nr:methyl-accepting chemotaxis protein [Halobacillus sp. Nhm2S1]MBX0358106.1 methyl-accepting chemotaxis protein [Halobacillus sp. Nhm2S1]